MGSSLLGQALAVLWRRPQATGTQQHDDNHGQCDQQLAQDGEVDRPSVMACSRPATPQRSTSGQLRPAKRPPDHAGDVTNTASTTTIAMIITDSIRLNDSGETKPWKAAEHRTRHATKLGAMPASNFMLRVLMPWPWRRFRLRRMAIQARPMPRVLQAVADHHGEDHQDEEQVVVQRDGVDVIAEQFQALARGRDRRSWPSRSSRALGPLVRLAKIEPGCSGRCG